MKYPQQHVVFVVRSISKCFEFRFSQKYTPATVVIVLIYIFIVMVVIFIFVVVGGVPPRVRVRKRHTVISFFKIALCLVWGLLERMIAEANQAKIKTLVKTFFKYLVQQALEAVSGFGIFSVYLPKDVMQLTGTQDKSLTDNFKF